MFVAYNVFKKMPCMREKFLYSKWNWTGGFLQHGRGAGGGCVHEEGLHGSGFDRIPSHGLILG